MMSTTALPVWAQTPETADSSVVEVEGTLENIIAAREALAARPATLAEMTTTFRRRRPWWSAWPMP